uniref:Dpy-30-like protein n=1 Tax=Heterorhabditis bacteriophora TaxID=37862 RepID=A0A1I7XQM7_HETBA
MSDTPENTPGISQDQCNTTSLSTRQYLDQAVVPILLQAMGACAKERPEDPIAYVANYLLKEKSRFQPHKDPTTQ